MAATKGRPLGAEARRDVKVHVRFSPEEAAALDRLVEDEQRQRRAGETDTSRAGVMRVLVLAEAERRAMGVPR